MDCFSASRPGLKHTQHDIRCQFRPAALIRVRALPLSEQQAQHLAPQQAIDIEAGGFRDFFIIDVALG